MTKLRLAASSLVLVLALGLYACTDAEQQKEIDRQKRIEQQEQKDNEEQARKQQEQQNQQPQAPAQPEQPAAPEPEQTPEARTVTYYYFTSSTEPRPVKCASEGEAHECGLAFEQCEGGQQYYCQVGVKTWTGVEEEDRD
jgi:cell division protein FtsN